VDAVRPSHCVGCGVAARAADGTLVIHGHGVRGRTVQGPAELGDAPVAREVAARRYACLACGAIMLVVPAGVLRRFLFLASAIAAALGRWAEGVPAQQVRREVSPQQALGATAATGWASLRRWVRTAPRLWPRSPPLPWPGSCRAMAVAVVLFLASFAPAPTGRRTPDAVLGAVHFRGCPSPPGGKSSSSHHP
jgi:hypothetical protein